MADLKGEKHLVLLPSLGTPEPGQRVFCYPEKKNVDQKRSSKNYSDSEAHAIRVEMSPVRRVDTIVVEDEVMWVLVVLHKPITPQVGAGFLIPGRSNHAQCVKVDCFFNGVG